MTGQNDGPPASELIDATIEALGNWRGELLRHVRDLVHRAEPGVVETVKWRKPSNPRGVPVWEVDGIICTGEVYKDKVKLTFAHGASLEDPAGVFNSSLNGNTRRAVDLREEDDLDEHAFMALVQEAAALNQSKVAGGR